MMEPKRSSESASPLLPPLPPLSRRAPARASPLRRAQASAPALSAT